jgi:hypothetical protein
MATRFILTPADLPSMRALDDMLMRFRQENPDVVFKLRLKQPTHHYQDQARSSGAKDWRGPPVHVLGRAANKRELNHK